MPFVPTRRLAVVAAAAAVVLLVPTGSLWWVVAVNGALLALAVLDAALAPPPRTLELHRTLPPAITLGATGEVAWVVRNPHPRSVRVALADELAPSLRATTRRFAGRVPGGRELRMTAELRPARRGRFTPRAVTVRVDGPLGLGARQASLSLPGVLRVLPSFRSKDEAELRVHRARIVEVGLRSARGRGGGTEFEQLREYTADDEFRHIDWAATARRGRPVVRTHRAERNQNVVVLLDLGRTMAGRVDGVPRAEHAVDAVLMLTALAGGLGDRCGLVAFDREVRAVVPPGSGRHQLGVVTDALYDLAPALVESDYAGAFTEALARFPRRALLVLLTDIVGPAVDDWLAPALELIVQHHLVLVAGVQDPDVVRWSSAAVGGAPDAFRRAAAVGALRDRERSIAHLRSRGATVVDAAPGTLAPALADAYLQVKATGRL